MWGQQALQMVVFVGCFVEPAHEQCAALLDVSFSLPPPLEKWLTRKVWP